MLKMNVVSLKNVKLFGQNNIKKVAFFYTSCSSDENTRFFCYFYKVLKIKCLRIMLFV